MWECWNAVQITSNSKSFSHIPNHVAGIWVLKAFEPYGFLSWVPFRYVSSNNQKVNTESHNIEMWECSCNAIQITSNSKSCGRLLSSESFWPL